MEPQRDCARTLATLATVRKGKRKKEKEKMKEKNGLSVTARNM
jgi:hypothetical protein